jgi:MSHA pilin protein MshA
VVVITILGILAAFAIPRFAALESEARTASMEALQGSLRSGAALAHALWLAGGETSPVLMEGNSIVLVNGYPDLATIDDTLASLDGFLYDATTGVFSKTNDGSTAVANCTVTYSEATAGPPVVPPTYLPTFGGC